MKDLLLIGASDLGREIAHLVERINRKSLTPVWNLIGFIDDNRELYGKEIDGYKVIGNVQRLNKCTTQIYVTCTIGTGSIKKSVIEKINNKQVKYATLIDPDAVIFKDCRIGEGCIICAGSILSVNTRLEKHVLVNLNCTLGHDDYAHSYCTVNPGCNISGKVVLKDCVDLGTGTKITQGITINERTVTGAGAIVVRDLPSNCIAVGCPAKPVRIIQEGE